MAPWIILGIGILLAAFAITMIVREVRRGATSVYRLALLGSLPATAGFMMIAASVVMFIIKWAKGL